VPRSLRSCLRRCSGAAPGLSCALWLSFALAAHAGDFNPQGRHRSQSRPAPAPEAAQPSAAGRPTSTETLISRYLSLLDHDPGADFPLERLVQLFRQRDGNLDALIAHFEPLAAQKDAAGRRARLALAGVYVHAGDAARAEALYQEVLAADPSFDVAARKLSQLLAQRGDLRGARERLAPTLKQTLPGPVREETLRSLIGWSLDLSDLDGARAYHAQLVQAAQGSFFVRAELARLLFERQLYVPAEAEYHKLVEAARGDPRTLAPALRDWGKALGKLGKFDEALAALREAEQNTSPNSGLRLEVLEAMVEVNRAADRLPQLVSHLEQEQGLDFDHLVLLARLEEETGQVDRARHSYEAALAKNPRSVDVRLKVIALLELAGELDKVIDQYRELTRVAPQNADFVFHLAEAYLQRGEQAKALAALEQLEARSRQREDTLGRLVEFYERVGENDRAMALLERLAAGNDPRHLVELGDRYFARGQTERALEIWKRLAKDPNDATALQALGQVYLDHDLTDRALETLLQAMKLAPDRVSFAKSYGLALERAGAGAQNPSTRASHYREAEQLWEKLAIHARAASDPLLAREARQHIVTLWSLTGTLTERVAPLERRLAATPPDLDAGRLLAETELRLRHYDAAEKALRRVIEQAPGDLDSLERLERALSQKGDYDGAIAVLGKLAELDPSRAKEYLTRMAGYAAEAYQDDRAISFAARAVELSPDDAEGHQRLGEMYRERQDIDHAILEFRQALSKNDRLFSANFQLAELLLNRGQSVEADQLLRHVMRSSPDEQLIARAAHLSLQIHLGNGTLEELEKELLPIALSHPGRTIYRRLLVELYGALAFPLESQAKSQDTEAAATAQAALTRIGQRAVKPLLDALADTRDTEQRVAIELLSHIQNRGAGPALINFASSDAEPELRTRAMLAAGALSDVTLLGKFEDFLFQSGTNDADPVSLATVWSIANLASPQAHAALVRIAEERAPSARALAVLGLGRLGDRRDARLFESIANSSEQALLTRAAAVYALAQLGDTRTASAAASLARVSDPMVRAVATVSLARVAAPGARSAIASALTSADAELASAGTRAACVLASPPSFSGVWSRPPPRRSESVGAPLPPPRGARALGPPPQLAGGPLDSWPMPDGRVDARLVLEQLLSDPCTPALRADALVLLAPDIAEAAARAAQSSASDARNIALTVLDADGHAAFRPLIAQAAALDPARTDAVRAALERISSALLEPFLRLAVHPSPEMRQSALRWLGTRPESSARQALIGGLQDADASVQHTALEAVSQHPDAAGALAVAGLLAGSPSWSVRRAAARALEQMGAAAHADEVLQALRHAAVEDHYALVRDAAARALFAASPRAAHAVLQQLERSDPEAQIKATAQELLARGESGAAW
jgi:tetratricopeptide (TPR) repeat protein/HEAT repeat protein